MDAAYDLFFSYRRMDRPRAQPLLDALAAAGLQVWLDTAALPDNAAITPEIRRALAASKALLAFYSLHYPLSKPCQEEIAAAWLAAQQMGEPPYGRVLIVNPEAGFNHLPNLFREQQSMGWAEDAAGFAGLAERVRRHLARIHQPLLAAAAPVKPGYHGMAPVEAPRFVGRVREMWDLHGQLTANRMTIVTGVSGQAAAQVRAMGGNGKSLLAREYAIRFGAAYPGGIFFLNAYGNDDTRGPLDAQVRESLRQDQLRGFAVRIGAPVAGLTPAEVEGAFWRRLAAAAQPCLWIVDDLPSGIAAGEIETRWIAQWADASTLITTRSKEYEALGSHLDLEVLTEDESWQLLTGRCVPRGAAEEQAARGIAAALGYHPLAIEVAGSFLAKGFRNFQQFLQDLRQTDGDDDALELGAELRESLPTGHDRSIARTLLKSIGLLDEDGKDFLRLASVLAVDAIPVRVVTGAFEKLDPPDTRGRRARDAVDHADSLSLCTKAGDDARRVHTLVSRTIRYRDGRRERIATLRKAVCEALGGILKVVPDIRRHPEVAREMVHARHIVSAGVSTRQEAEVAFWVARHDYERGSYPGARKLEEQVLETRRRLLGDEHPDTLGSMSNLASTLWAQGDLAGARKLEEQVLEAQRRLLWEEHPDTLISMNNLALTLHAQGDLDGARKLQEQVLEARRRLLGAEHPDTLNSMNNLASTLSAQGDLAGARKLEEQVLEAERGLLGAEHPDTLISMNNLAETLRAQGDLAGARNLQEQVLEAERRVLGEEHPDTLSSMNNLALTLSAQGDLAGARNLQEQVLEARRRLQGAEHSRTTIAAWNLHHTLFDSGDFSAARRVQDEFLMWLMKADRTTLSADQQTVQQRLSKLLNPPAGT